MTYPTISPELTLDFAKSEQLDPRITFTRSSTGTYLDSDGLIKTAPSGVARFEYDNSGNALGLLVEESRTNSLTYSAEFDNAGWTKERTTVTSNAISAPDGTNTADLLIEDTGTGTHSCKQTESLTSGTSYVLSAHVKANSLDHFFLDIYDTSFTTKAATFDLTAVSSADATGSPTSHSIVDIGGGWYRVSMVFTAPSTSSHTIEIRLSKDGNWANRSYTGTSESLYVWGAQLEEGTFGTSYIPTSGSTVTRAADIVSMTGTQFSSWYNNSEGSFVCEFNHPYAANGDDRIFMAASSNASADRIGAAVRNTLQVTFALAKTNSVNILAATMTGTDGSLSPTLGVGYSSATDGFRWVQQGVVRTATGTPSTAIDRLLLGQTNAAGASDNKLSGHITRLTYYSERVSDASLQELTS